jgi:DNA polymerase III psi subunit
MVTAIEQDMQALLGRLHCICWAYRRGEALQGKRYNDFHATAYASDTADIQIPLFQRVLRIMQTEKSAILQGLRDLQGRPGL